MAQTEGTAVAEICLRSWEGTSTIYYINIVITTVTIVRSEDELLRPQAATWLVVAKGHNILQVTEAPIRGQRPPYFVVARGHNCSNVNVPAKAGTIWSL